MIQLFQFNSFNCTTILMPSVGWGLSYVSWNLETLGILWINHGSGRRQQHELCNEDLVLQHWAFSLNTQRERNVTLTGVDLWFLATLMNGFVPEPQLKFV